VEKKQFGGPSKYGVILHHYRCYVEEAAPPSLEF
jgi:hypothetical protein